MIVWPEYIDLKNWSAALIHDFPEEQLPILNNEEEWQDWAAIVAGTGVFADNNIPPPFSINQGVKKQDFENWQEWSKLVYNIMMNSGERDVQ